MSTSEEIAREVAELRDAIDLLDTELLVKMSSRMALTNRIMRLKEQARTPPRDGAREKEQHFSYVIQARMFQLDERMVQDVFRALHDGAIAAYRHGSQ